LGEHLISDHVVGLLELVKNSYDADARRVHVALENLATSETTRITVQDDGFGMTADDVVEKFLSPAADHKAVAKTRRARTPKGRLPIGEKGVGRFALQQLGHELSLVTRAKDAPEIVVKVQWADFENALFLDQVSLSVVEREPEIFADSATGTQLVITHSRSLWGESAAKKVWRGLRRLQSPHLDPGKKDFEISFSCPGYPQFESLDLGDILAHSHYQFRALVDETGRMFYEYCCCHPALQAKSREDETNLMASASSELSKVQPQCGPFYLNLYVWDRSAEYLQQSGISRIDLDAMAGVSLFRDRLRVLPYGEPGDDWLHLDRDRINDPSRRVGNNQVIGFVEVDQEKTPELRDKTDRQGLIETPAFGDLRAMVRASIAFFNTLWVQDRPAPKHLSGKPVSTTDRLQRAHKVAAAIQETAKPEVIVHLPADNQAASKERATCNDASVAASEAVPQNEASRRLVSQIEQAIESDREEQDEKKTQWETLLHLAATGMAAERVVHEVGRQIAPALKAIQTIRSGGPGVNSALGVLEACLGTLRNEFRALAPFEGSSRLEKKSQISITESINTALVLNQNALEHAAVAVTVEGDDFEVLARQASVIQVFDNLINNAVVWTAQSEVPPRIRIKLHPEARTVLIGDSGPGVSPDITGVIFEPFVSTRAGGRGLGLYIARALMQASGGKIDLAADPAEMPCDGANFLLDFSGCMQAATSSHRKAL
jgi:anti-sigma regulatory factor (Ser/Thr protein kinase)